MLALAVLGAAVWVALAAEDASAFGKRKAGGDCGSGGYAGYAAPCTTAVTYVDQEVTAYRPVTEVKDVKVRVMKMITVPEQTTVWSCEPVKGRQKVTNYTIKTRQEAVKVWVNQMVEVKDKVKVCQYVEVTKDVPTVSYVPVYGKTMQKQTVCDTVCVPVPVTRCVPVYAEPCGSSGGGLFGGLCGKKKQQPQICGYQMVTTTVMQRQVVSRQVDVEVTTVTWAEKKGTTKVTSLQPTMVEKDVVYVKCVPAEKTEMRTVSFYEPVVTEVDVVTMTMVQKPAVRNVCKWVEEETVVKQTFCRMEAYKTVVKVPVYTPVVAPCAPPCGGYAVPTSGFHGGCCR